MSEEVKARALLSKLTELRTLMVEAEKKGDVRVLQETLAQAQQLDNTIQEMNISAPQMVSDPQLQQMAAMKDGSLGPNNAELGELQRKNRGKCAIEGCPVTGGKDKLRMCSGCHTFLYCSPEHQIEHWKTHAKQCKKIKQQRLIMQGNKLCATTAFSDYANNVMEVKKILESGVHPDTVDIDGNTALLTSLLITDVNPGKEQRPNVMKVLLNAKANPNLTQPLTDKTALHCAMETGKVWAIKMLLDAKADVNMVSHQGFSALHTGIYYDKPKAVKELLKHAKNKIDMNVLVEDWNKGKKSAAKTETYMAFATKHSKNKQITKEIKKLSSKRVQ